MLPALSGGVFKKIKDIDCPSHPMHMQALVQEPAIQPRFVPASILEQLQLSIGGPTIDDESCLNLQGEQSLPSPKSGVLML